MFEQTPDWGWYVALANLTKWAHWPAWAAFFSLAALWNTARLADRANRDSRRKEAVFLMAARELLDDFLSPLGASGQGLDRFVETAVAAAKQSGREPGPEDYRLARQRYSAFVKGTWASDRSLQQIEAIKMSDFPSVITFVVYSTAQITVGMIRDAIERLPDDPDIVASIERDVRDLRENMDDLEKEAEGRFPFKGDTFAHRSPKHRRASSLKSSPGWLHRKWTALAFPWSRSKASTHEEG